MRVGTVVNLRSYNKIFEFFIRNKELIILTVIFITGFSFGVFSFGNFSFGNNLAESFLEDFTLLRENSKFLKITADSFFDSLLFMLLSFVSGASIFGIVLVPFSVAARAFIYGNIAAFLYSQYSLKGIAFHAVMIMPVAVIFAIALLLGARESIKFSLVVAKLTLPATPPSNLAYDFKNYCGRYLLLCFLVLLSSVIDAVISLNFLNSFSLT